MDSAFQTWRKGETRFLAVPQRDGVAVLDEHGNHYGAYRSIKSFRDRKDEPIGKARLSVRPLPTEAG